MIIEIFNVCIRKVTHHYCDILKKYVKTGGPILMVICIYMIMSISNVYYSTPKLQLSGELL
jgi:hypothetical protein